MNNSILSLVLIMIFAAGTANGQSSTCASAVPICTGPTYSYPAGTSGVAEPGADYGCLQTQPAPAWFYMLVDDPGEITISMHSAPLVDIDFICWGPFADPLAPCVAGLTASVIVDCSYLPSSTEYCDIPDGLSGEYYILMITNFSLQPVNITFSQTAGNGSLDCSFFMSPEADFIANPIAGAPPLFIQFTDLSTLDPTAWSWDFQNDGIYDAFEQNPYFIYEETGYHSVKLRVENEYGVDSIVKADYISVFEPDILVIPAELTILQHQNFFQREVTGTSSQDTLTILNTGGDDLIIESLSASTNWIITSGHPDPPFVIDPGSGQQVLVDIDWLQFTGIPQNGAIEISSNDADEPLVVVPVTAIPATFPDLIVINQNAEPDTLPAEATLTVSCGIFNQDLAAAGPSTTKYFLSSDTLLDMQDLELGAEITDSVGSGQYYSCQQQLLIPENTPAGSWHVLFYADADFEVEESDEENNLEYVLVTVDTLTAIAEWSPERSGLEVSIYPNPARDELNIDIDLEKPGIISISLYDPSGKKSKTSGNIRKDSGSHSFVMDTAGLRPGLYLLEIKAGNERITRKVTITQ